MKIDNTPNSLLTSATLEVPAAQVKRNGSSPVSGGVSGSAGSVQLSTLSSSLQAIEKGFAQTPVVNSAHIDEIKQAIASGHFTVDASKVADRLLKSAQELIQAHKA